MRYPRVTLVASVCEAGNSWRCDETRRKSRANLRVENQFVNKCLVAWSSGKDSAWMVHVLRHCPDIEIGALWTTIDEPAQRVAMHAVRMELLHAQADSLGLPLWIAPLPSPCSNERYEQAMTTMIARALSEGYTHIAFGDLFLEDIRRYREARLAGSGLAPMFPLFGAQTSTLAREMVNAGLGARLICIDPKQLDARFAGREFDVALLEELPTSVDPCGERGEFHTFAYKGPMFRQAIAIENTETVARNGFVFTDLVLATKQ